MNRLRVLSCLVVLLFSIVACQRAAPPAAPVAAGTAQIATTSRILGPMGGAIPDTGETAPDFEYSLSDGTTQKLSDLRGKTVIINFWATWCEPCREEMPDLQRVATSHADSVVVLGVNKLEQAELMPPFAEEVKVGFLLIANPTGDISQRYGVRNIPTSFFVAPDGTVGEWHLGIMTYDEIVEQVEALQ